MSTDLGDFLDLEGLVSSALMRAWAEYSEEKQREFDLLLSSGDYPGAAALADSLDTTGIILAAKPVVSAAFRAAMEFGASLLTPRTMTSSLAFDRTVSAQLLQLGSYLEYGFVTTLHKTMMQSIADAQSVQKAEAVRPLVSFRDTGDSLLQMMSTLHMSRLSGWGFVAEAELLGVTRYKLSAQLDNRTSRFCRWIHGKVFEVKDAKPLLDSAVYTDNPDDLKALHPWPNQSNASMEQLEAMSDEEIVANRYHVPPFHPGCRTLMVAERTVTRLSKPRQPDTAPVESTAEDFSALGIKVTGDQLSIWNDYAQVKPSTLLQMFTGRVLSDLLEKAKGMLTITKKGNVILRNGTGSLKLSTGTGRAIVDATTEAAMLGWDSFETASKMLGAESITVSISSGYAEQAIAKGLIPLTSDWTRLRGVLRKFAESETVPSTKAVLESVANSVSPKKITALLALPEAKRLEVLSKLSFTARKVFDDTGLS